MDLGELNAGEKHYRRALGEVVDLANQIEARWRDVVSLHLMVLTDRSYPWGDLLLGSSRSVRDSRAWIETVSAWRRPNPDWFPRATEEMRAAEKLIERRNSLVHRPRLAAATLPLDGSAARAGMAFDRSRRADVTLFDDGQLDDLARDLRAGLLNAWEVWRSAYQDYVAAFSPE